MNPYFDAILDRRGTSSSKWDKYQNQDVIPMWVADMDFAAPPAVIAALKDRVEHPVFGYTVVPQSLNEVTLDRFATRFNWPLQAVHLEWTPGVVPAIN